MCMALDKELLVAGFINHTGNNKKFKVSDVMKYMGVLWNVGCGPISPNFTRQELKDYLSTTCKFVLKEDVDGEFLIDLDGFQPRSEALMKFDNDIDQAKRVELLLRLNARINIPYQLLKAIGYGFMCD